MLTLPRFYPVLDTGVARARGLDPVRVAADILEGGARILQFRHKAFLSREAFAWLEQIAGLARQAGAMFVVNDRADLAKLFGAALHLGQDDLSPSIARRVAGADAIIGYSTHNEAQLRAALEEPADYLALGPIFRTATKENPDAAVGLAELRRLRPIARARPLVAIGGIDRANVLGVLAAGADSVAVVADLFAADIRTRVREWVELTSAPPSSPTPA
jgi:thiamine-phosphate pyrophosphorylase